MQIWKYDESTETHLTMINVADDYVLGSDELATLPAGFLTPAKLVNGVLTSATQTESDTSAEQYRKDNGISLKPTPDTTQQIITAMNTQIAKMSQQITGLTSLVQAQNKEIVKLKGSN